MLQLIKELEIDAVADELRQVARSAWAIHEARHGEEAAKMLVSRSSILLATTDVSELANAVLRRNVNSEAWFEALGVSGWRVSDRDRFDVDR